MLSSPNQQRSCSSAQQAPKFVSPKRPHPAALLGSLDAFQQRSSMTDCAADMVQDSFVMPLDIFPDPGRGLSEDEAKMLLELELLVAALASALAR